MSDRSSQTAASDSLAGMTEKDPVARAEKGIYGFLVFVLVLFSAFYLYHAGRLILFPYTIDYGEGFLLRQGMELASGRSPYQPIDERPWLVANYPPVYPAAVGLGVKLFGVQYFFGRTLSLLGVLVAGFCLYRLVAIQTRDPLARWIAPLALYSSYPIYNWGTHHRIDSFGLGLEALGLLFLIRRERLKTSAFFFLLALFTRQTLLMGPLAAYFFLRRYEGPRRAAKWFGGLLGVGALVFATLTLATKGEFARHVVLYNANEFFWKDVWRMFHGAIMSPMQFPTLFLLFYLTRAILTKNWDLPSLCIPFAILTFLLVGKRGSATNYLFEFAFASSWAAAMTLAEVRARLAPDQVLRLFPPLVLGVGLLFPLHAPHFYGDWEINDWGGTPISASSTISEELDRRLEEIPGPIFSFDSGMALLSGHDLVYQPFIMNQLSNQGVWDVSPFHDMIRNKEFGALVLPFDLDAHPDSWASEEWWTQFTEETGRLMRQNYKVVPRLLLRPEQTRDADPRLWRGFLSPFWTSYLYVPR